MITLTTDMILKSVIFSFLLGVISCLLIRLLSAIAEVAFLKLPKSKITGVLSHFIEGASIVLIGVLHIVLNYATCDGALTVYSFLSLFFGVFMGNSLDFTRIKTGKKKRLKK